MITAPVTQTANEVLLKMVLLAWHSHVSRMNDLIGKLADEQWLQEISPGKNRGIYILGHLVAITDDMLRVLGVAERKYAFLDEAFVISPDKSGFEMPSITHLKQYWVDVNERLTLNIARLIVNGWFSKHALVGAEDFAKEPHRNKLNIIINRTNHLSYHLGQLIFLIPSPTPPVEKGASR